MGFDIDKIFLPSTGVDIIFNMNSLVPYSRSSIIYDADLDNETLVIAQPLTPFSNNTAFKELHLTSMVKEKSKKTRVGVECTHIKIIDHYTLANQTKVPAVLVKYKLPVKETNIRSAFRLPLSTKYIIKGKMYYKNLEYYTSRNFAIRDISLAGLGLLIPKKRNNSLNPLLEIKLNEEIKTGIILINMDEDKPMGALSINTRVVRINPDYSDALALVGLKTLDLKNNSEAILNRFIHDAQIDELKRMSRQGL